MQKLMQILVAVAFLTASARGAPAPSPAAMAPDATVVTTPQPAVAAERASTVPQAAKPLKVIATTPTYGDLAREIGGEHVDVIDLCRKTQDIHGVGATPSQMARLQGSDLVLYTGLDAEPWLEPMLRSSGNLRLLPGSRYAIALSDGIPVKEVPVELSRTSGDIHAYGNPHLWADPLAVRTMARHVRDALVAALPAHAEAIDERHKAFHERLTNKLVEWLTRYAPLKGKRVVSYHTSWPYLLDRFGLELSGTVEPKPRVAPTASHLERLVTTMKEQEVGLIIREPFQSPDATDFLQERTGARVVELTTHPEAGEGGDAIIGHFEQVLEALAAGLDTAPAAGG